MGISIGFMQGRLSPKIGGKIQAFPWNNWEKEFEIANKNSFKIMEWTLDQFNLYKNPLMTKDGQKKIKFLSEKYDVEIPSLTGDCFMQTPFYKVDDGKDQYNLLQDLKNIINACGSLDIKYIVFPLVDNGSLESKEQEKTLYDGLSFVNSLLQMNDVKIVFESDYSPERLKDFISNYPSKHYGINYDIGNSAALGFDSKEEIKVYGDKILNVHIKDRLLGGKTVPLGKGNAELHIVLNELSSIGYDGNYILQTARSENNHVDILCEYREQIFKWID
ncbi:MAG: xylose isomerase [Candidatus Marinimicrobia bacterium]|nr:xylose isomerase [Candidatus Neomarinimicrobiota bacterium]|tara:strand:+ start:53959 stop:54786 length:828 start_codon:yes stop_codon:yes gene_type:complete